MSITRHAVLKVTIIVTLALAGAGLMIKLDDGGAVRLKFVLYSVFFVAVFLAAVLSPLQAGCLPFFRKQTKG